MRIGLVIYGTLNIISGGYLYDRKLVEHLQASGDRVQIFSLPWRNYSRHLLDNLNCSLIGRVQEKHLDILLEDELNHPSLLTLNRDLKQQHPHLPIISIVHHLRSSENHPPAWRPLYRWIERRYLHSVDGFVYNSHTTARTVEQITNRESATQPSIVAYPAADHLSPPAAHFVKQHVNGRCDEAEPLRILFVGNLIKRKGLHRVVDALSRLSSVSWRLTVVGSLDVDPTYVDIIRRRVRDGNFGASIELVGSVSDDVLRDHFACSHLLVLPSYEGFGIVYLEAMSFGLPVIASMTGAAHEIVTHGTNGFLLDPANVDALSQYIHLLHKKRNDLVKMSLAARETYDRHPTWEQSMSRIRLFLKDFGSSGQSQIQNRQS